MADVTAPLFDASGSPQGEVKLNPEVFGIEPNLGVLHQVITAQLAGARSGSHKTKTRAEVSGGGAKPWRQKGTGRARHGSTRSPIWTGGGVAHGPQPRDYSQRTPKKMKRLALRSALSLRASEGLIRVIDSFPWTEPKTKTAAELLNAIGVTGKTLVVLGETDRTAHRSFRNLTDVVVAEPSQVTAYDLMWAHNLVFTSHSVASIGGYSAYEVSKSDFVKEEA
ncbi:MAG TPA: 50S ribosomal protein L4 [Acidimicrobiia bacterium]|nr:50S ribosomal protein L4 [Acidimicrobiia bacterium]